MIRAVLLGKKPCRSSVESAIESKEIVWIDVINPTNKDIEFLHSRLGIPKRDINNCLDQNEIPRTKRGEEYAFYIFKVPYRGDKSPEVTTLGVFVFRNKMITVHASSIQAITNLFNHTALYFKHVVDLFTLLIEKILFSYFNTLISMDEEIEKVEERVFSQASKKTAVKIFELKKGLIYFQRSLTSNREVLAEIKEKNSLLLTKSELKRFENLYDDCVQLISMSNTYKEILSSVLEIHTSALSNQLNQIIKKMTVIGSFVLIPTLIASIYGMNFGQPLRPGVSPLNMPELNWYFGYPFALTLMALSVIIMGFYFKKKKWI